MLNEETPTTGLQGSYRDELRDPAGQILWDSGWRKNQIVIDCRRLLAGFMRGQANTLGIQGLQVGAGDPAWDAGLPPPPPATDARLVDGAPFTVPFAQLKFDYLDPNTGAVSISGTGVPIPTNRLQIVATLGPGAPNWPNAAHATSTLREFGLVGQLGGATVLINAVRHVAIPKDPVSTLVRTIQLVF
jgi:hypothetical protein